MNVLEHTSDQKCLEPRLYCTQQAMSDASWGCDMTFSKEALAFIKACEAFIALVEKHGSTEADHAMIGFYIDRVRERLSEEGSDFSSSGSALLRERTIRRAA